jgi:hypothetical protein
VEVSVRDGLAGGESVVEADVENIGLEIMEQSLTDLGDQVPN